MNIGLIGLGDMGSKYFSILSKMEGKNIYLDDIIESRVSEHLIKNSLSKVESIDKADKLDVVMIVTPNATHKDVAKKYEKDVDIMLIEKPGFLRCEDFCIFPKNKIRIGYIEKYRKAYKCFKEMVKKYTNMENLQIEFVRKSIGKIRTDSNVLYDLMCHDLNMLLDLFSGYEYSISNSKMLNSINGISTEYIVSIDMDKNVRANLYANKYFSKKERTIKVKTKDVCILYDITKSTVTVFYKSREVKSYCFEENALETEIISLMNKNNYENDREIDMAQKTMKLCEEAVEFNDFFYNEKGNVF